MSGTHAPPTPATEPETAGKATPQKNAHAHNQYAGYRPAPQQVGQRTHEYVAAPARLQIAVDKGHQLVAPPQVQLPVQSNAGLRVGHHRLGVYAIVYHGDAVFECVFHAMAVVGFEVEHVVGFPINDGLGDGLLATNSLTTTENSEKDSRFTG